MCNPKARPETISKTAPRERSGDQADGKREWLRAVLAGKSRQKDQSAQPKGQHRAPTHGIIQPYPPREFPDTQIENMPPLGHAQRRHFGAHREAKTDILEAAIND